MGFPKIWVKCISSSIDISQRKSTFIAAFLKELSSAHFLCNPLRSPGGRGTFPSDPLTTVESTALFNEISGVHKKKSRVCICRTFHTEKYAFAISPI